MTTELVSDNHNCASLMSDQEAVTRKGTGRRILAVTLLFLLMMVRSVLSAENPDPAKNLLSAENPDPPFQFTEDQEMADEKSTVNLPKSTQISSEPWFSEPLTRKEMIAIRIADRVDERLTNKALNLHIKEYFELETIYDELELPSIDRVVTYEEELGQFVVRVKISSLGKPKAPMKQACVFLLKIVSVQIGAAGSEGFFFAEEMLNGMDFRNLKTGKSYVMTEKVEDNVLLVIQLEAKEGRPEELKGYEMGCYMTSGGEIAFLPFSSFHFTD